MVILFQIIKFFFSLLTVREWIALKGTTSISTSKELLSLGKKVRAIFIRLVKNKNCTNFFTESRIFKSPVIRFRVPGVTGERKCRRATMFHF